MPNRAASAWTGKHLLGLEPLSAKEILTILDAADGYLPCVTRRKPCRQTL
jgi:hypothetical protein